MALPVTISNSLMPGNNYFCGPFKAPNQQYYLALLESGTNKPQIFMATDPTSSFTAQDASNRPTVGTNMVSLWAYLSGSEIHITTATNEFSSPENKYHVFDTSSDTWTTTDEEIDDTKDVGSAFASCSIAIRSDGDVIVLYNGNPDADMGNPYQRVDYAREEGAGWTVGIDVGGTSPVTENRIGSVIVRGSGDNMHFFWQNDDVTNELHGRSLDNANNLSTTRSFELQTASLTGNEHVWCPGIAWDDAGTWRIVVPTKDYDTDELVVVRWVESSGALGATGGVTIVGSPEDVDTIGSTPTACGCVDGDGKMYVMWGGGGAGGADKDLYRDDAVPNYTAWSGETEVIDATTINRISCNVYPRDGAIKLAFVYNEAGTIKYNEVSITAPTAPSFANSRFPDQNYHIGPFKGP